MQRERIDVASQHGDYERHALTHQVGDEGNITTKPIQLRDCYVATCVLCSFQLGLKLWSTLRNIALMRNRALSPAARDGRAPVRHDQGPDGRDALFDQDAPEVVAVMALSVLAYNLTRAMNIVGIKQKLAAITA